MPVSRSDSPALFLLPEGPDFETETHARGLGQWPVAGVDEAGRGPLAGPVVAAAVILDPDRVPSGLDDSKRLKPDRRALLHDEVLATALAVSVASVCAIAIDGSDIRKASLEAMRRAVAALCLAPRLVIADGRDVPPGLACEGRALVKGDRRSQSIAAASIVAKVSRDRMMARAGLCDPRYGFELHAGYGTPRHHDAVRDHGPVARLHRLSFAPFRL